MEEWWAFERKTQHMQAHGNIAPLPKLGRIILCKDNAPILVVKKNKGVPNETQT